ncbi:hypothetical protein BHM03_00036795 [Ensete ventricosum]|nr:hypothetical protein BHM03_00036795 [Ensete ventricosum]
MPSTPTLAFPDHGQMFVIGADTSRVGIGVILMQDERPLFHVEAFPTLHSRLLICYGILVATEFKVWLDTGPRHEEKKDDSTQIHPPDISADEKVHVQLMIAWDRKIAMHHRPDTTTTDGEIQDNVGPQDHGALTVDTTSKLQEELQTRTQSSWSHNLGDKVDLKRAGLLGPRLSRVIVD